MYAGRLTGVHKGNENECHTQDGDADACWAAKQAAATLWWAHRRQVIDEEVRRVELVALAAQELGPVPERTQAVVSARVVGEDGTAQGRVSGCGRFFSN